MPDGIMKTIIIVAMTAERVIGKDGRIPWHDPQDLRHFKRTTMGHAVIMGRKTFESMGKPLPGRRNIVITKNPNYAPAKLAAPIANRQSSIDVVHSLDEALQLCRQRNEERAFIIGGRQVYEQALPIADEMIVTTIARDGISGDTYFPAWDPGQWQATPTERDAPPNVAGYRRVR